MNITETLSCYSMENLISEKDIKVILLSIDKLKKSICPEFLDCRTRNKSVHSVQNLNHAQTVAVYEPYGRIEIDRLPKVITDVMHSAFESRFDDIRRAFPSARCAGSWIYVEYGLGQYITPHIDLSNNEEQSNCQKVAGVSVQLNEDFSGGELYIETSGESRLWDKKSDGLKIADGADFHTEWFRSLSRTKWTSSPKIGTAFFYGSQLIHGTNPVLSGKVKKIIGFITE